MMHINQRKEQFSRAYVHAVASAAGFTLYQPAVDDDSIDLGVAGRIAHDMPRPPRLEFQLKCTSGDAASGDHMVYPLKRKNYDDLRPIDLVVPRILIVLIVPRDELEWVEQSEADLRLRRCAYWASLRGMPDKDNKGSVTISLPRRNLFSVEGLRGLMKRASRMEPL
ncbi:MAG: DUF4365 domain-containing protein [Isosphaeraceae bacterium]